MSENAMITREGQRVKHRKYKGRNGCVQSKIKVFFAGMPEEALIPQSLSPNRKEKDG
jgi:hypothetical protein